MVNVTFTDDEIHNLKLALLDAIEAIKIDQMTCKPRDIAYYDNRANSYRSVLDKIGY